jgi:phage I-like protein
MYRVGYWADLGGITFGGTPEHPTSWVHALPGGSYQHPIYGDLVFSDDRIKNFATSVTEKYRKIDPDIDYDHKQDKAMGNKAAGWVQTAEVRPKGTKHADFGDADKESPEAVTLTFDNDLWLFVEWTPAGAKAIKAKEWRYFSSELADEWTDEGGTTYKDVLFGGGLTNRPYMKELLPLNLSELTFKAPSTTPPVPPHKGDQVDPKELRRKLHLAEDASNEAVDAKLAQIDKLSEPPPSDDKAFSELMKLAEGNPLVAQFLEAQKQTTAALAEVQNQLRLSETTRQLSDLTKGPDIKVGLTAATLNEARDLLIGAPKGLSEKFFALLKSIADGSGLVALGEFGKADPGKNKDGGDKSAIDQFNDLIKEAQAGGMEYADAVEAVSLGHRELYNAYREASYLKAKGA